MGTAIFYGNEKKIIYRNRNQKKLFPQDIVLAGVKLGRLAADGKLCFIGVVDENLYKVV